MSLTDAIHERNNARVMTLAWQPRGRHLIVGWTDGGLTLWDMKTALSREISKKMHKSPIQLLIWSPYGNRFISSDEDGLVVIWKMDVRGYVMQCCQYRRSGKISTCCFSTSPHQREKNKKR